MKRWIFVLAFAFLAILIHESRAVSADGGLRGEPFSDPSEIMEKDSVWIQSPVTYPPEAAGMDLSVMVNQQVAPFLLPLVEQYAKDQKLKMKIDVGTCGTSAGALNRKSLDVGGFCCPPGLSDRLPGLRYHTVGITPLLLLVHKDNPVKNVTLKQARMLFQGLITNWSELGGPDLPVQPVGMLHCKKRPGHWRLILDNADMFGPYFKVTSEIEDTLSSVGSSPGAVGFEIMMNLEHFKFDDRVRPLMIDGHDPMDLARLQAGKYPFYRTMNLTTWEGQTMENPHALPFVRYMMQEVERVGPQQGIVPLSALKNAGWKVSGDELVGEPR